MSDEPQPEQGRPVQIDGPVARPPVKPQVQPENLNVSVQRRSAPQWHPGDPVVIIEDAKEHPQPAKPHER